ncbi:two pore potassium channel protein sup-9-like [Belonocnema kinseyi]|uniref:two pore potassium channel protein sup-9-like n=1 Tax=Belonocnema kinseyi TaxID=2817044 RepID=UPI00143DF46B|nr:two pore potassium channel protein sup-9-like [Belonocnema kinseyi]XP_033223738.1 two pore potassium channel protein sup-9-like [Belonocnema kinseyi]XP_033223739.1 two pore potassium channel protein sup-9-like [Belonocnema kinseyi]XP_033223740.1 two pore potassium channel protein sup-9-like [Belonocnema kinseyi]XP_033223741.1 two pore potassium channel protein sup-9-like [Belonocnema kinseyi]XP_033223742.1 two pore potassium channel protein sup-9-like [Belonocnema kinseyi]
MDSNDISAYSSVIREWQGGSFRGRSGRRKKKRQKPWSERIADWTRAFIAFLFSNVGIVCLVVSYTIAGAFLFQFIEGKNSLKKASHVLNLRNDTAFRLWELTSQLNVFSERSWKERVRAELQNYQKEIVSAIKNGYDGVDSLEGSKQWSFAGAFLYSLTVITTIGYGNTCPRTKWGKVATIVYAIVGMPLFLLYLSNIGDILARSFKWTYARCCLCRCRRRPRGSAPPPPREPVARRNHWQMVNVHGGEMDTSSLDQENSSNTGENDEEEGGEDDDDDDTESKYDPQSVTVPLTICFAIMVGYVCGGALLFSEWETWDFLDGSYFCFISLSTIGFGDIVPGDMIYSGQGFELSFVFCSMYLMLGMALIAMCFNLMQEEVIAKMRTFVRTVKHMFRCDR